jgi:hypothetical protein
VSGAVENRLEASAPDRPENAVSIPTGWEEVWVVKKVIAVVVIAFAAFYVFTQPEAAADAVRGAVEAVFDAFEQLTRFVTRLFS